MCKASVKQIPNVKRVIFSGIQPTGIPHVGNYFGAINQWLNIQKTNDRLKESGRVDCVDEQLISIVDLHALTIPQSPAILREKIYQTTCILLACGIDPEKTVLFQQSAVKEHSELAWILSCITTIPKLQHLPQWKEKSCNLKEPPLGLFTYPVLQAADILLYNTTHVPVGEDQITHIELWEHKRLKSLRNASKKMSKSDPDEKSRIGLIDSDEEIMFKLRKAITDVVPSHQVNHITYEPAIRPAIASLVDLHCACTDRLPEEVVEEAMFMDSVSYKSRVADALIRRVRPIREEYMRISEDREYVLAVLRSGAIRASDLAADTMDRVRSTIGIS